MSTTKIPHFFKSLLWSYDISRLDPHDAMRIIVVQTVNSGEWRHWQWVIKYYGKDSIRRLIEEIPKSEFRPEALALATAVFRVRKMKYASRGAYIRSQRAMAKD